MKSGLSSNQYTEFIKMEGTDYDLDEEGAITPATTGKTVRIRAEVQLNPGETLAASSDSRVEGWVDMITQQLENEAS